METEVEYETLFWSWDPFLEAILLIAFLTPRFTFFVLFLGTQKYVHIKCLRRWQENVQKRDVRDGTRNYVHFTNTFKLSVLARHQSFFDTHPSISILFPPFFLQNALSDVASVERSIPWPLLTLAGLQNYGISLATLLASFAFLS